MRIPLKSSRSGRKGYALMIVLCFVFITLYTLGSLMQWTASSARLTGKNNQFLASESAAESADELVVATMTRDYLNQSLNAVSSYTSLVPTNIPSWPLTYQFTDASNTLNRTTVTLGANGSYLTPLSSQFSDLQGYIQPVTISSTATPTGQTYNVPATVVENIEFDTVPIFQFAIFYNLNLEICPGGGMTIYGPVFSNGGIWASGGYSGAVTFDSSVDAVGVVSTDSNDPFCSGKTGTPSPTFTVAALTNQPSLTLPIAGTNNSALAVQNILTLPPAGQAAPNANYLQASNQTYIFNEADLIISNAATGINGTSYYATNITIYYENSNVTGYLQLITNDMVVINKTARTTNLFYSFVTNVTFYDYRESDTVQALQIDVAKFNKWLTNTVSYIYTNSGGKNGLYKTSAGGGNPWNTLNNSGSTSKGHDIDSIYVYNKVGLTSGTLPAVRMINGAQLPSQRALTIATPQPLYIYGNYNVQTNSANSSAGTTNTAYTYPAALMGDAITILSTNWSDSYGSGTSYGSRAAAAATTINAACLEGIVQSTSSGYSGGVENFLRLEENWGSVPLYYNGSIIVMFYSGVATNAWQNTVSSGNASGYYDVPSRHWSFDNNFQQASKLPPLTPSSKSCSARPEAGVRINKQRNSTCQDGGPRDKLIGSQS